MHYAAVDWLLHFLGRISLQVVALAFIVWIICRFLRNMPASVRYGLWLLVVVKVLIPPITNLPPQLAVWQRVALSAPAQVMHVVPMHLVVPGQVSSSGTPGTGVSGRIAAGISRGDTSVLGVVLFLAWLAGAMICLVKLIFHCRTQGRLVRSLVDVDPESADLLVIHASRLGIRRLPKIAASPLVATPLLIGVFYPTVVLPCGLSDVCSREEISAMLLHELAHVRRWDMVGVWLYRVAQILFFFHPAVWLTGRELERERELACDELVLASSAISPVAYAAGYLSALKLANGICTGSTALAMAEPFDIEKRRLISILDNAVPRYSRRWALVVVLIALAGVPTFSGVNAVSGSVRPAAVPVSVKPHINKMVRREIDKAQAIQILRDSLVSRGMRSVTVTSAERTVEKVDRLNQNGPRLDSPVARQVWVLKARVGAYKLRGLVDADNGNVIGFTGRMGREQ